MSELQETPPNATLANELKEEQRLELAAAVESVRASGGDDLDHVIEIVSEAAEAGDMATVAEALAALRPADRAKVFETLELDQQSLVIAELDEEEAAEILEAMEDEDAAEIASTLHPEDLAPILDQMDPDEAADVLGDLSPEQQASTLAAMDDEAEADVRALMAYPDESAGGRMTTDFIALHAEETVAQSIERLRELSPEDDVTYYLYTVNADGALNGIVSLRQLVVARPDSLIKELADPDVISIQADDDQEAAARLMSRYWLMALPVVDAHGRLLGVIAHDDLVDVLEEEATEDMYRLVGLSQEERPGDPVGQSVRRRLPWLVLNLFTQLLLMAVLYSYQDIMAKVTILAVLFPLVTGNGGNVGAQTTTIMVRALALGEVGRNQLRLLFKEVSVGLILGMVIGLLAGGVAMVITNDAKLVRMVALATFMAMTLNLTAGGLAGVVVPLSLRYFGQDPAISSAVFVTTVTDTLGALFFLGFSKFLIG